MARIVRVTYAHLSAAKLKVKRSATTGGFVSRGVEALDNAKRASGPARSAVAGRFVAARSDDAGEPR